MSTEHNPLTSSCNETVALTSFNGGKSRGRCLQLTQTTKTKHGQLGITMGQNHRVQLTREQVADLAEALELWLIDDLPLEGEEACPGGNLAAAE